MSTCSSSSSCTFEICVFCSTPATEKMEKKLKRIEIDDQVYAELGRHVQGFEQPNDVLRRLLLPGQVPAASPAASASGQLAPLLAAGVIHPGDALSHVQKRKGGVFAGTVESDGTISTVHGRYQAPSPALKDLVGSSIDGWAFWTHVPSGRSLRQLRGDAGGAPRRSPSR